MCRREACTAKSRLRRLAVASASKTDKMPGSMLSWMTMPMPNVSRHWRFFCVLVVATALAGVCFWARGQNPATRAAQPPMPLIKPPELPPNLPPAKVPGANAITKAAAQPIIIPPTRIDFEVSTIRLERWMAANPPPPEVLAKASKAFDRSTELYLAHTYPMALHALNDAFVLMQNDPSSEPLQRFAGSLRVRMWPRVLRLDKPEPVKAELRTMYGTEHGPESPLPFICRVVGEDGVAILEQP